MTGPRRAGGRWWNGCAEATIDRSTRERQHPQTGQAEQHVEDGAAGAAPPVAVAAAAPSDEADPFRVTAVGRREGKVAAVAVLAWIIGAAVAASLGMWFGMGATAILVGAGVLVAQQRALRASLRPEPRQLVLGLGMGLLMAAATHLLYGPVTALLPFVKVGTARLYVQVGTGGHLLRGLLLVPIALAEELVWRGSVQSALRIRFGPVAGVLLGAVLYAVSHAPIGAPVLVMTALVCGLVWGALRAVTGGLVAAMVAHVVWDEILLFVAPLVSG